MFLRSSRRDFLRLMTLIGCGYAVAGPSAVRNVFAECPEPAYKVDRMLRRDEFDGLPRLDKLFSDESPWKQSVKNAVPLSNSELRMRAVADILREGSQLNLLHHLHDQPLGQTCKRFGELYDLINSHGGAAQAPWIASDDWTFPIVPVLREDGKVVTCELLMERYEERKQGFTNDSIKFEERNEGLFAQGIPLPACPIRPGGPESTDADGNIVLIDVEGKKAYDFWQVTTARHENGKSCGGGILGPKMLAAGGVSVYKLDGLGAPVGGRFGIPVKGADPEWGGRASGLPYLGGLIVPEDLAEGVRSVIKHALVFALPRSRYTPDTDPSSKPNCFYPAARTETYAFTVNPLALASGERIRLKPDCFLKVIRREDKDKPARWEKFKRTRLAPITRIFLTALQEYGAFLADGGGGFGFYAESSRTAPVKELPPKMVWALIGGDPEEEPSEECQPGKAWDTLIGTVNDQLTWDLFRDDSITILPFALTDYEENDYNQRFHANFEVVTHLAAPKPRC